MNDRVIGWAPDGKSVLFASSRESGRQRYNQFYAISIEGGQAQKLPVPYGEQAVYSPDGKSLVYTPKSRLQRTWKRYRGGSAADIFLFDLNTYESENLTGHAANDELPMWHNNTLYFLSDRGENYRYNIWSMDLDTRAIKQLTDFEEFDVHYPAMGNGSIVFEAGGELYVLDLESKTYAAVEIKVVTDQIRTAPRIENVSKMIQHAHISPDGKRAVVQARGELFSLPAEHGYVKNMSRTFEASERYPSWSPNGKYIAYWSDQSGEYELMLRDMKKETSEKLTSYGAGYRYPPNWSPDGKKIAFIDETLTLRIYDLASANTTTVGQSDYFIGHGGLRGFDMDWSADSRWLTYSLPQGNQNRALFIYEVNTAKNHQVTSGFYSDRSPVFDPEGMYLYFLTNRHFSPVYSDFSNDFVYPNATRIAAVSLRTDVESPLKARNDEVEVESKDEDEGKGKGKGKDKNKDEEDKNGKEIEVKIDMEGFEQRVVLLPPDAGNFSDLAAAKCKVVFHKRPNSGSESNKIPLMYYDLKEREQKTVLDDADGFVLSGNKEKLLVRNNEQLAVIDLKPEQKMEKPLPVSDMEMTLDPKAEWQQIFSDAWRFQRDFFYDPGMHGVDWEAMRKQYGALIEDAVTRWDVNFIIGELIGELNASHTYRAGGDTEEAENRNMGYLGIDWALENDRYRIAKIIKGAPWDIDTKSPLDQPGVDVREGDYILAVNGISLNVDKEPFAAFDGLAGKTVELSILRTLDDGDSTFSVYVETLSDETRLRHLAWMDGNRQAVDEASGGDIGYVYVRSTGIDGQNELIRQFQAQFNKKGLIIDERFNSGGQIPDRFVELLSRPPLSFWAVRHGKSWQWPPAAHFGPKAMLINGWSGSGGDAFPDYFRKRGLGPLIGTRTWGGLIGISGAPGLIDGGFVSVPTFRMYDPDGEWFQEGYGVEPDIQVPEDPTELAKGIDPQIQRAVKEVMQGIEEAGELRPEAPEVERRN